jgi:hypothetical protein
MWQETIVLESHTHKDDGKVDRRLSYFYCAACMSVEWACTLEAALAKIRTERPDFAKKAARAQGFKDAMNKVQELYPVLTSHRAKRTLTRNFFSELFSDVMHCILRKAQVLRLREEVHEEYRIIIDRLAATTDKDEAQRLVDELDKLEAKIDQHTLPLAFREQSERIVAAAGPVSRLPAGPAADEEAIILKQFEFQMAADYSDCWIPLRLKDGKLSGGFNAFYICLSDGGKCSTIILSRKWDMMDPANPLCFGQRWYCRSCGARYRPAFGQLVEIIAPRTGVATAGRSEGGVDHFYALAPCPDTDDRDLKAQVVEHYHQTAETPEQLFDQLPEVAPQVCSLIRKVKTGPWRTGGEMKDERDNGDGCFKIVDVTTLQALPMWSWKQIYNFFGIEPPAPPGKKKKGSQ